MIFRTKNLNEEADRILFDCELVADHQMNSKPSTIVKFDPCEDLAVDECDLNELHNLESSGLKDYTEHVSLQLDFKTSQFVRLTRENGLPLTVKKSSWFLQNQTPRLSNDRLTRVRQRTVAMKNRQRPGVQ